MSNYWKNKKSTRPKPRPPEDIDGNMVTGIVDSIVYRSEESGYTVCYVKVDDRPDTVTIVGTCPVMWVGETLTAEGQWERHKQHGFQFRATGIECLPPSSEKGIERYLASGMIDGIGKVNAQRIVEKFGKDTLRIIEKESKRLEEVEGVGRKRRRLIKESWDRQKGMRDIMIFMQGHGIGMAQATRIIKHYGNDSVAKIRSDPYQLYRDIWGIGFKTADSIAMSVGIPPDSEIRARAGLIHVLQTLSEEGHCFCPRPDLLLHAEALLQIPVETLADALNYELRKGSLVLDEDRIYLSGLHEAEVNVADKIRHLLGEKPPFKPIDTSRALPWAEKKMGIQFDPVQKEALECAMSEKVSIITGGPGVGKTTIIKALVDVFNTRKLKVILSAPTGRAAKRMNESTGHESMTIHRLLKFIPAIGRFEHGPGNPVEGDVFILDEVSMIDILLMNNFLSAIPQKALLILVGDIDQLPSVGPGNVLGDLIHSGRVPCKALTTVFRQQERSGIVTNAHLINSGESIDPISRENAGTDSGLSDFYFITVDDPEQVIQTVVSLLTERIPGRFGMNPLTDVQVLTPMRRNQLGTENLNALIQQKVNPHGPSVERFGNTYRLGDRVMQIRNNYDKEVFNGDIGIIRKLDAEQKEVQIEIDGRLIKYELSELDELIHAYACTIHKSQGSEYPAVIIVLSTQHFKLLQRNLLYTAVTRGRHLVCLVGSRKAVNIAIANNQIKLRQTALRERLQKKQNRE